MSFYRKHGFVPTGTREPNPEWGSMPSLVMRREL